MKVEVNRTRIQSRQMLAGDKLNVDVMRDDVQYQNGPIQTSFYKLETEIFRQGERICLSNLETMLNGFHSSNTLTDCYLGKKIH